MRRFRKNRRINSNLKIKKHKCSVLFPIPLEVICPYPPLASRTLSLSPSPRQSVRRALSPVRRPSYLVSPPPLRASRTLSLSPSSPSPSPLIRRLSASALTQFRIMASSHSSSSSEDDHNDTSGTVPKKRGLVYMSKFIKRHKEAGTKATVEWNRRGHPIGKVADNWRNYLGVLVRCRVPIIHTDWRKVPKHFKENVWREATAIFDGVEEHKNQELSAACKMWKQFKSRLAHDYIYGDGTDEDALKMYTYIDSDHWKTFKEQRLSEAATKLRDTNKDLVKKNVYKHVLGRGGYRKLEEAMTKEKIAELISQGAIQEEQTSNVSIERHDLWKRGRIRKNVGFVSEATQEVATKIWKRPLEENFLLKADVTYYRRLLARMSTLDVPEDSGHTFHGGLDYLALPLRG